MLAATQLPSECSDAEEVDGLVHGQMVEDVVEFADDAGQR